MLNKMLKNKVKYVCMLITRVYVDMILQNQHSFTGRLGYLPTRFR